MGRGWRRAGIPSTAPVPYPTDLFQITEAVVAGQDICGHQQQCAACADLDRVDRDADIEIPADEITVRLVLIQPGRLVAPATLRLPRFGPVDRPSLRGPTGAGGHS